MGCSVAATLDNPITAPVSAVLVPSNSQPPGSSTMNTESADIFEPSPSHEESTSIYSHASVLPYAPLELPVYQPVASPHFHWGPVDAAAFSLSLDSAYQEVVHWRKNSFDMPHGSAGKQFVAELAQLCRAVGEGSALESVALKAVFVACVLLLQKPSRTSKPKDHAAHLERRLLLWHEGKLKDLIVEGRAIQSRLPKVSTSMSDAQVARSFASVMFEGKTSAAIKLLTGYISVVAFFSWMPQLIRPTPVTLFVMC